MKADEVYAKLKKMIGLVSVGMKNTTSTQNPDGSVTITINFTSGSPLSFTMAPVKGDKGVGIKDAQIKEIQNGENTEYHLILIDDKDNNIDAGNIPIPSVGSYPDTTNLATKSELKNHTDNTNIHVTSAEKSKWNAKLDNTDLTNYATKTYVTDEIVKATSGGTVDLTPYAKKVDVNASLDTKVDKVPGKSLISDAEISRLAQVDNYDDTSIKSSITNINSKLDTKANKSELFSKSYNDLTDKPVIPDISNLATQSYVTEKITEAVTSGTVDLTGYAKTVDVNASLNNKVDKVTGKSLISDTEIARLANINNYDDTNIKNTLNKKANTTDLTTHTSDTNIHVTSAERTKWNNKAEMTDIPDLTNYATKTYVTDEIAKAATSGTVDLTGYATTIEVDNKLASKADKTEIPDISNLATKDELSTHTYNSNIHVTANDKNNWNSRASDFIAHKSDTDIHVTANDKKKWNAKLDNTALNGYATETYVTEKITEAVDLTDYAKTADVNSALSNKVDKVDGKSLVSDAEITRLSKISNYDDSSIKTSITNINSKLDTKANKSELFSKSYNDLTDKPTIPSLTGYAKLTDIPDITAKADKIYVDTELSKKANKSELFSGSYNDLTDKPTIPSLDGYATQSYVTDEINKASLSGTVDLTDYAKTADVNSALSNKVDKVDGKSLVSDTEIERLKNVDNYDDTAIKESINSKANTTDLTTHTSDTNIHITTAERNKWNEVDNKIEALKTSQSIEYGGTDVICNNTLASRTSDMLIKGQTNQNNSKIESAGEKENKISILSKNKESADDNNYKQDKKEILLQVDGGLKSLPNNVADTIEQRNDGVYLVQRVGKVVLNGSETWTKSSWSMTNTFKFDFEIGLVVKLFDTNATNQILCDTFKVVSRNSLDNVANREFESICPSNSRSRTLSITISKTKLNNTNTTGAFKQWLSNNPVTVYYELETPIETKLDINSLDLEVYKDTTYVTTDNAIQPTLSFKVPSNIGGIIQENAQNINKLYKYKVDKVDGKGLSSNDYTTEEKTKVSKIVTNGNGTSFLANDGTYKNVGSSASAVAERKFKHVFGFDTYWGEMRDNHGNKNQVDLATIKEQIDQCEEMKVDRIICTIHIGWDETTNSLVIAENTDSILSAISYCNGKNVTIDTAKVHVHFKGTSTSEKDYINNVIGMSTFQTKYKAMLTTICNLFKDTTVTRIIILNEMWYITNAKYGYSSFVNECLNIVKSAGYATGLSMAGFNSNLELSDAVIQNIDTFYINSYPGISGFGGYITKSEAIEAFKQCDVDLWIEKTKKKYPDKKIVISEMGTDDYWENLAAPSSWQVNGTSKTGGHAVDTYITAMMEFFINKHVDIEELWWWYNLYYEPVKETLLNYLGGDR